MIVKVVGHSGNWEREYELEARKICDILGDELINIFHIGSTSVRGLPAKPVIDIMPVVHGIERIDILGDRFESLGYEVMGEYGIHGRRFYRKGGPDRTHHVHLFQFDNVYEIERHLAFRDYLRANPDVCCEYGKLKTRLAEQFPDDIEAYMDGKDDFVRAVERAALRWRCKQRA